MKVAAYVNDETDVDILLPWAMRLLDHARRKELIVILPKRSKDKADWVELAPERLSDESAIQTRLAGFVAELHPDQASVAEPDESHSDANPVRISVMQLRAPDPNLALFDRVEESGFDILVIDVDEPVRKDEGQREKRDLFLDTNCETIAVRGRAPDAQKPVQILVAADQDGFGSDVALQRAHSLAENCDGKVTFLFVYPDEDEVADEVALITANRLVKRNRDLRHKVHTRIALADRLLEGVSDQKDLAAFDLVLVPVKNSTSGYKFVRAWEKNENTAPRPLAIVKGRVPHATRFWSRLTRGVRSVVPQMDRELRVGLVDRLHSNSKWDFDFIALISLSTLIAALGLVRNSVAVVIGAMLVAPLMTPLVGIGFALVQGNLSLVRQSLRSLWFGFALAFVIGVVVGVLVKLFGFHDLDVVPGQMIERGNPNLLDLVVALVSGMAGAYAMGRPKLVSALPGVAIAAALVPPIATSGIALAIGEARLSGGSLLLFLTNIVAIVLGCTIVFWAVGIDSRVTQKARSGDERKSRMWPRYVFLIFVILSIILAASMHYFEPT